MDLTVGGLRVALRRVVDEVHGGLGIDRPIGGQIARLVAEREDPHETRLLRVTWTAHGFEKRTLELGGRIARQAERRGGYVNDAGRELPARAPAPCQLRHAVR